MRPDFIEPLAIGHAAGVRGIVSSGPLRGSQRADDRLGPTLPGVNEHVIFGLENLERPTAKGGSRLPERNVALEVMEHLAVPGFRRVPRKGPPVVGIVGTFHADLVAVVDRWGTGVGHLEERRQSKRGLVTTCQGQKPRHVAAVALVHMYGGDIR